MKVFQLYMRASSTTSYSLSAAAMVRQLHTLVVSGIINGIMKKSPENPKTRANNDNCGKTHRVPLRIPLGIRGRRTDEDASSGNRTRAARVTGEHSTTEPTMLCYQIYLN